MCMKKRLDWMGIIILIGLFISFLDNGEYKDIKFLHRLFIISLYVLIICIIWGTLYLTFTPAGADFINGVQPRYFISLIFPILFAMTNNKFKINIKDKNIMTSVVILGILANLLLIYNVIIKAYII